MKKLLTLALFLCGLSQAFPQVFEINRNRSYFNIAAFGTLDLMSSVYEKNKINPLTESKIASLDKSDLPFFDRWAVYDFNDDIDTASSVFVFGGLISTLFNTAYDEPQAWDNMLVLSEILLTQSAITNWTKIIVLRNRPFLYGDDKEGDRKRFIDSRLSFYSLHTSTIFSVAVFNHYYLHHTNGSNFLIYLNYGLAASTAVTRVMSGNHFPSDVLIGAVVGSAVSYYICRSHRSPNSEFIILSSDYIGVNLNF